MKIFRLFCFLPSLGISISNRDASKGHEVIEPYSDHKLGASFRNLRSMRIPEISPSDWMGFEEKLVQSSYSRHTMSESIQPAAAYIESQFQLAGLSVSRESFELPSGGMGSNIIGRLVGSSAETILLGAHYDDLPEIGAAPGADDNASGIASLLSVAQALTDFKPHKNIVFVAFSGEEQGMIGSGHFAKTIAPSMNIISAIIMDQNGNPGSTRGIILESLGNSSKNQRIIDTLANSMDIALNRAVVNYNGFGSDHVPLSHAGIPAVLVIERENMEFAKKYGHTSRDDLSNIDPSFGAGIANTVLEAVVRLAMAD